MKLRTVVLMSLVLGLIGAFLAFRFLEAVPLAALPFVHVDPLLLGRILAALLAGVGLYAIALAALAGGAILTEILSLRRALLRAAAGAADYLKADSWEGAFADLSLEPLQYRMIARSTAFDDDRLLLAAPFSVQTARTELRGFYPRQLGAGQLWTFAILLLVVGLLPVFPSVPGPIAESLGQRALAADALIVVAFAFFWLLLAAATESLISVLSRLPLMLDAAKQTEAMMKLLHDTSAAVAQLPIAAAAAVRGESEMTLSRVEKLVSQSLLTDRAMLERLAEGVTGAVFASLDKRLAASLKNFDRLASTTREFGDELTSRITALPEIFAQQYAGERQEMMRTVGDAITATQRTLHETLDGLRESFVAAADRQFEELRQVGAEGRQANIQLAETVGDACTQIERERQEGLAKTGEMIDAIEAYTASLLPAIKRLEGVDERLLRAVGQQEQTLSQLAVAVTELSGIIAATRMVLAQGRTAVVGSAPTEDMVRAKEEPSRSASAPEQPNLAALIRSLLDEMEDKTPAR